MPKDASLMVAPDERAAIIHEVADAVIAQKAQIAKIREGIREQRAKLKALGIGGGDFNTILRLYELEPEDRDAAVRSLAEVAGALNVCAQGELFADVA